MKRREILRTLALSPLAARWAGPASAASGGPNAADLDLEAIDRLPARSKEDEAIRGARTYAEVKRALLRAAIAVAADGPGAVGRVLDPSDGKPFDLRPRAVGFELTSRFALAGRPAASLVVGRR